VIRGYLELVQVLDECQLVIKKEKAEESKKSEASGQLYNILVNYVQQQKLMAVLDRNLLQAKSLEERVSVEKIFSSEKLKSELRPSNIVRFYEKAQKAQKSIINMEKDQIDPLKQVEYEFFDKLYQTMMTYYIALDYANEKKFNESQVVL
jgi:HJR/Mrr/RecB family endonuclease